MSDTPRTDSESDFRSTVMGAETEIELVPAKLSRTLENELNETNEKLACLRQNYADLSQLYDEARKALMESVAYVVHMPGVAAGDEYWTRRIKMAARWRKAAGLGDSK